MNSLPDVIYKQLYSLQAQHQIAFIVFSFRNWLFLLLVLKNFQIWHHNNQLFCCLDVWSLFVLLYSIRWKLNLTFWMIKSVMNAKDCTVLESLLRSSARMSCVSSTTVSIVGPWYIHHQIENFTSHWSRRVQTGHGHFRSVGVELPACSPSTNGRIFNLQIVKFINSWSMNLILAFCIVSFR